MTPPESPWTIPERLTAALGDRYHISRELGAGGMATVYIAYDVRHDREVALKVLRPELAAVLGPQRFLQEIRISAKLDHPHILTLIDSGEADGILYYVLPFVRGESLRARLEREKQLPLDDALAITSQVASALDYAHQQGIIHRDIKPENILLHEGEAVVADFGIALALTEAGGGRLTETGLSLGTPHYMSPEQATSDWAIDARSDIYSLGAVLYEMLAGEPPHSGASAQAVIAKLLVERPTRLRVVRDAVPEHVDAAVQRALAKTPADRFPTASAFARALTTAPVAEPRARPRLLVALRAPLWRAALATTALAASALAAGVWLAGNRSEGRAQPRGADPRRLAVLYFRTSGGDSLRPVADGLTEGLIRELSRVRTLQVISANGVLPFRDGRARLDSVGRALGVGSLVEGSVSRVGSRLRVSVALVDASNGAVVESAVFERPEGDVLALQDSVAMSVALFLRQRLGEQVEMRADRGRAGNPDAWRFVQEARSAGRSFDSLLAAGDTALARRALERADTLLGRAAALEPRWATPLSARGWLALRGRYLVGSLEPAWAEVWTSRAIQYADAALRLSPEDAEALALRGVARYFRSVLNLGADSRAASAAGDSAESDLRAATTADPSQSYAWSTLSHRLMRIGRLAEGKLAAMNAYESDPYTPDAATLLFRLYGASLDLEDRLEATRWCNAGRSRFSGDPVFVECQITVQALPGQRPAVPEMWRLLDRNVALYPPNQREFRRRRGEILVAMTLVRAGLPDSARAVALRARADAAVDPGRELAYLEMFLRNILGDREEALRLAAAYYAANPQERKDCGTAAVVQDDETWWMRGLAEDPRYRTLRCTGR